MVPPGCVATNQLRVTEPPSALPPHDETPTAAARAAIVPNSLIHLARDIPGSGLPPVGLLIPSYPMRGDPVVDPRGAVEERRHPGPEEDLLLADQVRAALERERVEERLAPQRRVGAGEDAVDRLARGVGHPRVGVVLPVSRRATLGR